MRAPSARSLQQEAAATSTMRKVVGTGPMFDSSKKQMYEIAPAVGTPKRLQAEQGPTTKVTLTSWINNVPPLVLMS